jgi:hypothetical protein
LTFKRSSAVDAWPRVRSCLVCRLARSPPMCSCVRLATAAKTGPVYGLLRADGQGCDGRPERVRHARGPRAASSSANMRCRRTGHDLARRRGAGGVTNHSYVRAAESVQYVGAYGPTSFVRSSAIDVSVCAALSGCVFVPKILELECPSKIAQWMMTGKWVHETSRDRASRCE